MSTNWSLQKRNWQASIRSVSVLICKSGQQNASVYNIFIYVWSIIFRSELLYEHFCALPCHVLLLVTGITVFFADFLSICWFFSVFLILFINYCAPVISLSLLKYLLVLPISVYFLCIMSSSYLKDLIISSSRSIPLFKPSLCLLVIFFSFCRCFMNSLSLFSSDRHFIY